MLVEQIKYKLVQYTPDDTMIVNTQQSNAAIKIGFAARQKPPGHHNEKTN
jgi:hypothetical protein